MDKGLAQGSNIGSGGMWTHNLPISSATELPLRITRLHGICIYGHQGMPSAYSPGCSCPVLSCIPHHPNSVAPNIDPTIESTVLRVGSWSFRLVYALLSANSPGVITIMQCRLLGEAQKRLFKALFRVQDKGFIPSISHHSETVSTCFHTTRACTLTRV